LRSRFISIGFRQAHDEEFMMKIFDAGSVKGHYGFVDDQISKSDISMRMT
jgi:hypothetical protein